jgi:superfamily I DNA/RNA helicase
MSFQSYLPVGFSHSHENRMFEQLAKTLAVGFAASPEPVYLIGNAMFEDREVDGVLLKSDALFVIDMKDYGGMIHFSETSEWFANEIEVKGGAHGNPYRQIRANKFALLNFLKRHGTRILPPPEVSQYWHICGLVLFGRDIQFDEKMPRSISNWFTLCDFRSLLSALSPFRTHGRLLLPADLERLLGCLGLTDRHIYNATTTPVVRLASVAAAPGPSRLQILYYNQSNFRSALLALRQSGGRKTAAAMRLLNLIQQAGEGIDGFATLPCSPDPRVENALTYTLNEEAQFVAIKTDSALHLCFCGTPPAVESWLQANSGLTLAVDGDTLRIDATVVTTRPGTTALPPTQMTEENLPFLARVKDLDLETLVPVEFIRDSLLSLDENSPEIRIQKVLAAVPDQDARLFLQDVISLAKAGDLPGAEARIRLRKGEACPVVDAQGLTQNAIASDANSDQVLVLSDLDPAELERLLDPSRFQEWMLFLHPDQRRVAEADFNKPVVLTGVSGSGKTCILVHRARYLTRKYPGERIGILTLNRSLARLLRHLVDQLCLGHEAQNIHVMAFYDYFSQLLGELGPGEYLDQLSSQVPASSAMQDVFRGVNRQRLAREFDPLSGETTEDTWHDFYATQHPELKEWFADVCHYLEEYRIDASRYLREEFTLVRSAFTVTERSTYLDADKFPRAGRTIPLLAKHRADILRLLLYFEEYMLFGEVLDVLELTLAVTPTFRKIRELPPEKRFRCLLVDEFQDFSTLDLRLLLWVPPRDTENALFLTGDPVQKILVKRVSLRDAGLAEGSAIYRRIRKNYRNSRQILRAASKLANLYGELARKSGEDIEVIDPELAVHETAKPIALKTNHQVKKAWEIAQSCLAQGQTQAWTICIATASPHKYSTDSLLTLRPASLQAEVLSGDYMKRPDNVVVSTLNDIKGFEFNLVLVVGCDLGVCPAADVPEGEIWRDALRFYVCMTRARDQIYLLHESEPSPFILQMEDTIDRKEEPVNHDYQPAPVAPQPNPPAQRMTLARPAATKSLHPHDSCADSLSKTALDLLRRYYDSHIDNPRNHDCRGLSPKALNDLESEHHTKFRRWLTPANLARVQPRDFFRLRNVGRAALQSLQAELRRLGITLTSHARESKRQPATSAWRSKIEALGRIVKAFPPHGHFQLFELEQPATFSCSLRKTEVTSTKIALDLWTGALLSNAAYGQLLAQHPSET